ncbi:MAG: putative lipid II flippase FtsW [Candidatus Omnitrophica bacterium]|nr:putative lipid II flippase FtsW [Candidatus Omnitrophota bacterium]
MIKDIKKERRFIFITIFIITLIGLLMVYESSSIHAFATTSDATYFFKKQISFFIIGLFLFCLTLFVDLELLRRWNKELLLLTILCLVVVVFLGRTAGGAKRWLYLAGFNIQPAEILKISFLIYCADYCRRKKGLIGSLKRGLLPLAVILGSICILLLLQPDLGTAVFWVIWTIFFLFLFKARRRHLVFIVILGLVASFFLVKAYPYRLRRITAYLNPSSDPQGAGFQLRQSKIAYGEGGLLGVGLGEGRQKLFFLPASHTDFVFSIVAEEFGLWGSLGLLSLFFLLFHKMFKISKEVEDTFRSGILWGVVLIFFLEITINIGVSCGLLPTKGLPLPFMSYGGSNLVVHYVLLGLFFNASRAPKVKL